MQWIMSLTKSDVFSMIAILISIWSAYLSRRAQNVSSTTSIRPLSLYRKGSSFELQLYNTGPGVAFNVRVLFHSIENKIFDPIVPGAIWYDDKVKKADGVVDIQPDQQAIFNLKVNFWEFNFRLPVIIAYELASKKRIKTYWKYSVGFPNKFEQMSLLQISLYKLNRFYLYIKSPILKMRQRRNFAIHESSNDSNQSVEQDPH